MRLNLRTRSGWLVPASECRAQNFLGASSARLGPPTPHPPPTHAHLKQVISLASTGFRFGRILLLPESELQTTCFAPLNGKILEHASGGAMPELEGRHPRAREFSHIRSPHIQQ